MKSVEHVQAMLTGGGRALAEDMSGKLGCAKGLETRHKATGTATRRSFGPNFSQLRRTRTRSTGVRVKFQGKRPGPSHST